MWLKNYPACFPTLHSYQQWVKAAIAAKEEVSPCDDCSAKYTTAMIDRQRCMPVTVKTMFYVAGRTSKPTANS